MNHSYNFLHQYLPFSTSHSFIPEKIVNPQYVRSQKGKLQLVHNGFKFGQITWSQQKPGRTQWQCTTTKNGKLSCKAKATTYKDENGNEHALLRGIHNHSANNKLLKALKNQ